MSYSNYALPKKMTFNVPVKDDMIFASDKNYPQISTLSGTITPRRGTHKMFDIVVKDENGNTSKGVLKHGGYDCWQGKVNGSAYVTLKYQHALKRGYVSVHGTKLRRNPHTQEDVDISRINSAPLHISDADNKYISPKDPKRISFHQRKTHDRPAIRGQLINTQNNALRKVQFQVNGEKFKGEMSLPMMDMQSLVSPRPFAKGYAVGDKGSLAEMEYSESRKKRFLRAFIKPNEYIAWNDRLRKSKEKVEKTQNHVICDI